MSVNGLTLGLTKRLSNGLGGGVARRGSSAPAVYPTPPANAVRAIIIHPNYCASDAAHVTPCADGDSIRWIKDAVTNTWYEQATAGARPTFKDAGGGKYYAQFDGIDDFFTLGTFSSDAASCTIACNTYITAATFYGTPYSFLSPTPIRELRQIDVFLFWNTITDNAADSLTDGTPDPTGAWRRYILSCGAATVFYRNGASVATDGTDTTSSGALGTLTIGNRAGASLWYNGRINSLIVVGSALDASGVASLDTWYTGATP